MKAKIVSAGFLIAAAALAVAAAQQPTFRADINYVELHSRLPRSD